MLEVTGMENLRGTVADVDKLKHHYFIQLVKMVHSIHRIPLSSPEFSFPFVFLILSTSSSSPFPPLSLRDLKCHLHKEHPEISKSERKRICRLMDYWKLSAEACLHAVQNEQLPLLVVVQVLFFEQLRATTYAGNNAPKLSCSVRALLPASSHGSSSSTTINTEEWDVVPTAEDIKALKGDLTTLRLGGGEGSL